MSQGRRSPRVGAAPVTEVPQCRQKRAPGGSGWRHAGHVLAAGAPPDRVAPHALQKRPDALAPHDGQTVVVAVTMIEVEGGPREGRPRWSAASARRENSAVAT